MIEPHGRRQSAASRFALAATLGLATLLPGSSPVRAESGDSSQPISASLSAGSRCVDGSKVWVDLSFMPPGGRLSLGPGKGLVLSTADRKGPIDSWVFLGNPSNVNDGSDSGFYGELKVSLAAPTINAPRRGEPSPAFAQGEPYSFSFSVSTTSESGQSRQEPLAQTSHTTRSCPPVSEQNSGYQDVDSGGWNADAEMQGGGDGKTDKPTGPFEPSNGKAESPSE